MGRFSAPFAMSPSPDPASPGASPRIRPTLDILRIKPDRFLVVEPSHGRQHEIGVRERFLIEMLDGTRGLDEINRMYGRRFGAPLPAGYLEGFVENLRISGFLEGFEPEEEFAPTETTLGDEYNVAIPLTFHDPGGKLNHRFDLLAVALGWLLHPEWLIGVAVLVLLGINALARDFSLYIDEFTIFLIEHPLLPIAALWIPLAFFVLNVPREALKGMACRRFGGRVHSFSVHRLFGFYPTAYCNVGDSVLKMNREQAIIVGTIGLWYELCVASVAAVMWSQCEPFTLPSLFWMMLVVPVLIGAVLRLNPLSPYEGYLMLRAYFERPRLREESIAEARAWLAGRPPPRAASALDRYWARRFGVLILLWQKLFPIAALALLTWIFTKRWEGVGALFALVIAFLVYREDLRRSLMESPFRWLLRGGGSWQTRWAIRIGVVLLLVLIGHIPWDYEIGGDARLIPGDVRALRTQIPSELVEVHVSPGQHVEAGTLVATLAGRNERADLEKSRALLAAARAQLDLLRLGARAEELAAAREQVQLNRIELEFAESELNREKRLATGSVTSAADLERAQKNRDARRQMLVISQQRLAGLEGGAREEEIRAAEAEVERLEAEVRQHEERFSLREIKSPIAGEITASNLNERVGQFVQPGDVIAVVQNTAQLRALISADEAAAAHIEPGQPVAVRLYGLDGGLVKGSVESKSNEALDPSTLQGEMYMAPEEVRIESIGSRTDGGRLVEVRAALESDDASGDLEPGMTGYAKVKVRDDVLWRALWRPVRTFFLVTVWSWLP